MLREGPNRKLSHIHAYSLIELMVVVSIVGILSTVAVPSYKDYVVKSKVVSLMPLTDAFKVAILERHNLGTVYGATQDIKIAAAATGKPANLQQLAIENYGCLQIDYDLAQLGLANGSGEELSLVVCPNDDVENTIMWNCGHTATTTLDYVDYLPVNCQQEVVADTSF